MVSGLKELKNTTILFYFLLMMKEEITSKRESESMALLEKLIRLDSKDCNFHFKDEFHRQATKKIAFADLFLPNIDQLRFFFKVSYPQTNTDNNSNDGLLKQLWHHVWAHYFRKLEQEELKRLQYLKSIFGGSLFINERCNFINNNFFAENPVFLHEMEQLYTQDYLSGISQGLKSDREIVIWIKSMIMQAKILEAQEWLGKEERKKSKLIYSKLKQNRKHRRKVKTKKLLNTSFKEDQEGINDFIEQLQDLQKDHRSQIDEQIAKLERQIAMVSSESSQLVQKLQQGINKEFQNDRKGLHRNFNIQSEMSEDNQKDLECLEYLIHCMEEKQIAQSISKVISTERSQGEIMFQIAYEKAINIQPKLITEKQLTRANFLRETSLLHFYRTGVKSLYSYISHNYVGFRELMQSRQNITNRLKDKCLLQMMKKGACLASISQIQHEMSKFNTCHHCKFLFPDYLLFTCKFTSDKQAIPKANLEALGDPNLAETYIQTGSKSRTSQRFTTRKKNCLTSYAKIHDEYICGRKYCFSCLKDTYAHENIRQNGLCPFCLGVCICTRCLRNQKIAKFKNMYTLLGGDLTRIQQGSDLEQLQTKCQDPVQRNRGRPKKYTISHISVNITQKKLRKFEQKQNNNLSGCLLGKKKRKSNIYHLWKRNDSGNDTQEENDPKRKKKRGFKSKLDRAYVQTRRRDVIEQW